MAITMMIKIVLHQNRTKITINNNNKSSQRGARVSDSTINSGKYYSLVHIGEQIFQTARGAIYDEKENNRIKIWKF